jgi:hypothetical protein
MVIAGLLDRPGKAGPAHRTFVLIVRQSCPDVKKMAAGLGRSLVVERTRREIPLSKAIGDQMGDPGQRERAMA